MSSSTKLDYVPLGGTAISIKLRPRPLEAMTLLWETHLQWIDVKHHFRVNDSLWYLHSYQI